MPPEAYRHILTPAGESAATVDTLYSKSWAIVVGINDYPGSPLLNARNDADAIARLLKHSYKFEEVHTLFDTQATKSSIEGWLKDTLRTQTKPNDRVIFFFSGHGTTLKNDRGDVISGHLIPYGAASNEYAQYVDMKYLQDACQSIPAKHILFILDCCFSGVAAITGKSQPRTSPETLPKKYIETMMSRVAWQIITAGASDELVIDSGARAGHSSFTMALLDALQGAADQNKDRVIMATELALYITPRVSQETTVLNGKGQTPFFNRLIGSEEGDFVFLVPDAQAIKDANLPLEAISLSERRRTPRQRHLVFILTFIMLAGALGVLVLNRYSNEVLVSSLQNTPIIETALAQEQAKKHIVMVNGTLGKDPISGAGIIVGSTENEVYIVTANHLVKEGLSEATDINVSFNSLPNEGFPSKLDKHNFGDSQLVVLTVPTNSNKSKLSVEASKDKVQLNGDSTRLKSNDNMNTIVQDAAGNGDWFSPLEPIKYLDQKDDVLSIKSTFNSLGASGGGLFTENWQLVGMVVSPYASMLEGISIERIIEELEAANFPINLTFSTFEIRNKENVSTDARGVRMVNVPAGRFVMGSTEKEVDDALSLCPVDANCTTYSFEDELNGGEQFFSEAFWIDENEITRGQYEDCVKAKVCDKGSGKASSFSNTVDQPINNVTWKEAVSYCKEWRKARLPTEAEWEYAARGSERFVFPWGNDITGNEANHCDIHCTNSSRASKYDDGFADTAPVNSFTDTSWVGAKNMAGNVWEWTSSMYQDYPYINDNRNLTSDEDINDSTKIILRGGAFDSSLYSIRSTYRLKNSASEVWDAIGFRCVRSTPDFYLVRDAFGRY